MPIVVMKLGVNESSLNLRRQHDFPTPESPINKSFICTMETHVRPVSSFRYLERMEGGELTRKS